MFRSPYKTRSIRATCGSIEGSVSVCVVQSAPILALLATFLKVARCE